MGDGIRTHTEECLRLLPLPIALHPHCNIFCQDGRIRTYVNHQASRVQTECSNQTELHPDKIYYKKINGADTEIRTRS